MDPQRLGYKNYNHDDDDNSDGYDNGDNNYE